VLQEQVVRDILPATRWFFEVEPKGVEPLTSAVQRRLGTFISVRRCSRNRLFKRTSRKYSFETFATVRPGNCQVTVNSTKLGQREGPSTPPKGIMAQKDLNLDIHWHVPSRLKVIGHGRAPRKPCAAGHMRTRPWPTTSRSSR
jgi:hypothetical protein